MLASAFLPADWPWWSPERGHWRRWQHPQWAAQQVDCWIYQLQEPSRVLSGNKLAKLDPPLQQALAEGRRGLATFGGAFSNHLAATAAACAQLGLASVGWVRSFQALDRANPTLNFCHQQGMVLRALTPQQYRQRHDPAFLALLQSDYADYLWVPEGGSSADAVAGVARLDLHQTPVGPATHIATATGSGGTLAGLALGHPQLKVLGVAVVKDASLFARLQEWTAHQTNWQLITDQVGAGYARCDPELVDFCLHTSAQLGLGVEPVYTGKALRGLLRHYQTQPLPPRSRLVFWHTGGLQGVAGLRYRGVITPEQAACLLPLSSSSESTA